MPVKSFKFVSPGVFINEIDNSFRPRRPDAIGPVIIGRSVRGLAMQPVKLESYSDFLTMYGDTVPGNAGGDIYRDGNYQSPMYGTYAAKAFLNASVAPVTYVRMLGVQNDNKTSDGLDAGWQTTKTGPASTLAENGGAYGLWVFPAVDAVAAEATITATGVPGAPETISLTSSAGTIFTLTTNAVAAASADGVIGLNGAGTNPEVAQRIAQAVNLTCDGEITAAPTDGSSATITLTQTVAGLDGNTTTTNALANITLVDFAGGTGTGGDATSDLGTGVLSAVWYLDQSASIQLSGNLANTTTEAQGIGEVIESDSNGLFTATVEGAKSSGDVQQKLSFNFDDSDQRFIRKVFNTNPQLVKDGNFYAPELERNYWLGETFEQEIRDGSFGSLTGSATAVGEKLFGVILPIKNGDSTPAVMRTSTDEAQTGWVIGQDLGAAGDFDPAQAPKLFRLKGRGHGEWLNKNVKVSIEKIRYSNTSTSDFGSFSIVIRSLTDTDSNPVVLERFDNVTLDPRSPNYISRVIGDQYYSWVESERRLRLYGEYPNQSKFVYVSDINEGNIQEANSIIPFGYYGPPTFSEVTSWSGSVSDPAIDNTYIAAGTAYGSDNTNFLSGANGNFTGSLKWPVVRLRHSASDGGLSDQTDAYFGMQTTRTVDGTRGDQSMKDYHRLWVQSGWGGSGDGLESEAYIFTLDDVVVTSGGAYYDSGARAAGTSDTAVNDYQNLIDAGYNKFTMPLWGGFDGFDITKPDPLWNGGMESGANDKNNYIYNTYKRAVDTVADPEFVDMNLLASPGLTNTGLTTHMVDVCEARADALALIDLPDVYKPNAEGYTSSLAARQIKNPTQAANDLRDRQIDSSYGATFYPWVQTVDEPTGQALWIPPSIAMMGVLASSERSSQIWFAPAGFNRGGLSDGAAGIPVTGVSRRLTSKERDVLYEARINPIASFPSTGIVVFGQKTLQERPSALDRINVRRLVIYLKKQISILSTQILFEQNVQATWNRFKGLIEPFLANVKTQFGITDYRLILDESTTTPDLVDQNVVYAKIMIKPARAIEYIAIDFIVASTGASFDD